MCCVQFEFVFFFFYDVVFSCTLNYNYSMYIYFISICCFCNRIFEYFLYYYFLLFHFFISLLIVFLIYEFPLSLSGSLFGVVYHNTKQDKQHFLLMRDFYSVNVVVVVVLKNSKESMSAVNGGQCTNIPLAPDYIYIYI